MKGNTRFVFRIEGIVQGVGFRPFVYGLCVKYHLKGYVLNNALGVIIDIEGLKDTLYDFEIALMKELHPLARIDFIAKEELPLVHYDTFKIHQSDSSTSKYSLVSPLSVITILQPIAAASRELSPVVSNQLGNTWTFAF